MAADPNSGQLLDVAATTQRVVDIDLPCVNCGYNLRALATDGNCPECGTEVRASAEPEIQPAVARALRRGVAVLAWSGLAVAASYGALFFYYVSYFWFATHYPTRVPTSSLFSFCWHLCHYMPDVVSALDTIAILLWLWPLFRGTQRKRARLARLTAIAAIVASSIVLVLVERLLMTSADLSQRAWTLWLTCGALIPISLLVAWLIVLSTFRRRGLRRAALQIGVITALLGVGALDSMLELASAEDKLGTLAWLLDYFVPHYVAHRSESWLTAAKPVQKLALLAAFLMLLRQLRPKARRVA